MALKRLKTRRVPFPPLGGAGLAAGALGWWSGRRAVRRAAERDRRERVEREAARPRGEPTEHDDAAEAAERR